MVKCRDCGFLAVRMRATHETPARLIEVEDDYRSKGAYDESYDRVPICFMRKADLRWEIGEWTKKFDAATKADQAMREPLTNQLWAIIDRERECDGYTDWLRGWSPREHLEMQMLEEQRNELRRQAEADQVWRERQDTAEREWRSQESAATRREHRILLGALIAAIVIPIIAAIIEGSLGSTEIIVPALEPPPIIVEPAPMVVPDIIIVLPTPLPSPDTEGSER